MSYVINMSRCGDLHTRIYIKLPDIILRRRNHQSNHQSNHQKKRLLNNVVYLVTPTPKMQRNKRPNIATPDS